MNIFNFFRGISRLKKNIIANFIGNIWQALMSLAFVPLYIKYLGVEAYGLIGIFATLQTTFGILDMGLSSTLTREMARLSGLPGKEQEMRDLVRSLEIIYWCVAVVIGIIVMVMAPLIAHQWVKPGQLSPQTVEQALKIMGFVMALQWPVSFYSGGLRGLQEQVSLNLITVGISTLRGAGAVLILWLISPTIQAFFLWQIIISVLNTSALVFLLWYGLPRTGKKASFQKALLLEVWRFAAGMTGISILTTVLTQLDKVILSKMLTLEMFGYYTLAGVVACSLSRLVGPVFSAIFPRLTELVARSDQDGLKQLYHKSCQFMSVLIFPVAVVVAMFSYEILLLWTGNPVTAEKTHLLVSILICGTALNGMMNIPYALQLAHGWIKFGVCVNGISVLVLAPMIFFLTKHYGVTGGASVWVILNMVYFFIAMPFMHRRLMPSENWRWYIDDVGKPLLISLLVVGGARLLMRSSMTNFTTMIYLSGVLVVTVGIVFIGTPVTRGWLFSRLLRKGWI